MGINRSYVSGLELGPRNPTILTLWHAAKAIGVTVRAFFDDEKLSLRRQRFLYGMAGSERSDHRRSFVLLLALWLRRIFALVPGGFGFPLLHPSIIFGSTWPRRRVIGQAARPMWY